jgi:hypothetical protein
LKDVKNGRAIINESVASGASFAGQKALDWFK